MYCGKPLLRDSQKDFGYCSEKCRNRKSGDIPRYKIKAEVAVLLAQYERGGWEGY